MSNRKPLLQADTAAVLAFLREYTKRNHGMAPTIREMADGCFIAASQIGRHLDVLEAHGIIHRERGRARGIWLVTDETDDGV